MNGAPLSVIVPTFRDGPSLHRALKSIVAQTLMPAEIIVIDDAGGDDQCARILSEFKLVIPCRLITLETNIGPGGLEM